MLYRSYLWMPGMMLFFPLLLAKLPGRRTLLGLGLLAMLLVPLAWNRLWVFADDYRLWNDAALLLRSGQEPGADRIFYNRGKAYAAAHKWEDAIYDFQRAVALSPQLELIRITLGWAYLNSGRYEAAVVQYDAAIAIKPDDGAAYYGKGLSLMGLHASEQASQNMKKGCELGSEMACMMVGWSKSKK